MNLYSNIKKKLNESEDYEANRNDIIKQAAEYIFNDVDGDWDSELIDYERFTDYYMDLNKRDFNKAIKLVQEALGNFAEHHYFDRDYNNISKNGALLELNDNHTMWELNNSTLDNDDSAWQLWDTIVTSKIDDFKEETGEELYGCGRSGRHICVEPTFENCLNFDKLQEVQERLEQAAIDEFNNYGIEENINESEKLNESYAIVNYWDSKGEHQEKIINGSSPKNLETKVKKFVDKVDPFNIINISQASSDVADSEYLNSLGEGVLRTDTWNFTFEESEEEIDQHLLALVTKKKDLLTDDTIDDDLAYDLMERIDNELINSYSIEEIEKAEKLVGLDESEEKVITNLDTNNMVEELKKHFKNVTNKDYIKKSLKMHLEKGFITKEEYNKLKEEYKLNESEKEYYNEKLYDLSKYYYDKMVPLLISDIELAGNYADYTGSPEEFDNAVISDIYKDFTQPGLEQIKKDFLTLDYDKNSLEMKDAKEVYNEIKKVFPDFKIESFENIFKESENTLFCVQDITHPDFSNKGYQTTQFDDLIVFTNKEDAQKYINYLNTIDKNEYKIVDATTFDKDKMVVFNTFDDYKKSLNESDTAYNKEKTFTIKEEFNSLEKLQGAVDNPNRLTIHYTKWNKYADGIGGTNIYTYCYTADYDWTREDIKEFIGEENIKKKDYKGDSKRNNIGAGGEYYKISKLKDVSIPYNHGSDHYYLIAKKDSQLNESDTESDIIDDVKMPNDPNLAIGDKIWVITYNNKKPKLHIGEVVSMAENGRFIGYHYYYGWSSLCTTNRGFMADLYKAVDNRDLSKDYLHESDTEDYWDATELERKGFCALLKFNHPEKHMNPSMRYIITNDNNEVYRFAMQGSTEQIKDTGAKIEFRKYLNSNGLTESESLKESQTQEIEEIIADIRKEVPKIDEYLDAYYKKINAEEPKPKAFIKNKEMTINPDWEDWYRNTSNILYNEAAWDKFVAWVKKNYNVDINLNEAEGYIKPEDFDSMNDEDLDEYLKFLQSEWTYHTKKRQAEIGNEIDLIEKILTDRGFYIDTSNPDYNSLYFDMDGNQIDKNGNPVPENEPEVTDRPKEGFVVFQTTKKEDDPQELEDMVFTSKEEAKEALEEWKNSYTDEEKEQFNPSGIIYKYKGKTPREINASKAQIAQELR